MQEMMEFYKSKNYFAFYDKNCRAIRIRRSKVASYDGKTAKHVMCFGTGLGLSKLALERWAGRVLNRLDRGATEDEANVWIHAQMADFRSNPLWSREAC